MKRLVARGGGVVHRGGHFTVKKPTRHGTGKGVTRIEKCA